MALPVFHAQPADMLTPLVLSPALTVMKEVSGEHLAEYSTTDSKPTLCVCVLCSLSGTTVGAVICTDCPAGKAADAKGVSAVCLLFSADPLC